MPRGGNPINKKNPCNYLIDKQIVQYYYFQSPTHFMPIIKEPFHICLGQRYKILHISHYINTKNVMPRLRNLT